MVCPFWNPLDLAYRLICFGNGCNQLGKLLPPFGILASVVALFLQSSSEWNITGSMILLPHVHCPVAVYDDGALLILDVNPKQKSQVDLNGSLDLWFPISPLAARMFGLCVW